MIQKTLTLGSLFDGSGGFPLGGILAGIEPVSMSIPLIAGYAAVYPKVTKQKQNTCRVTGASLDCGFIFQEGFPYCIREPWRGDIGHRHLLC